MSVLTCALHTSMQGVTNYQTRAWEPRQFCGRPACIQSRKNRQPMSQNGNAPLPFHASDTDARPGTRQRLDTHRAGPDNRPDALTGTHEPREQTRA
eukprot:UN3765